DASATGDGAPGVARPEDKLPAVGSAAGWAGDAHALQPLFGMATVGVIGAANEFAETPITDHQWFAADRTIAPDLLFLLNVWNRLSGDLEPRLKREVKLAQHGLPFAFPFGNFVQTVFHTRGELIVHHFGEVLGQQVVDDFARLRRHEPILILLDDVLPILNDGDGRSVSAWTPDAVFFQRSHQTGFGITRWRLSEVLRGQEFEQVE